MSSPLSIRSLVGSPRARRGHWTLGALSLTALLSIAAPIATPATAQEQPQQSDPSKMKEFPAGNMEFRTYMYFEFAGYDVPQTGMAAGDGLLAKWFRTRADGEPGWLLRVHDLGFNGYAMDNVGCGKSETPRSTDFAQLLHDGLAGVNQLGAASYSAFLIAHGEVAGFALKARSIEPRVCHTLVMIDPIGPQGSQPMDERTPARVHEDWLNRYDVKWRQWGFGPRLGVLREDLDLTREQVDAIMAAYDEKQPPYWVGMLTPFDDTLEIRTTTRLANIPVLVIRTPAADEKQVEREEALVQWMTEHGMLVTQMDLGADPELRSVSGLPWMGSKADDVFDRIYDWYTAQDVGPRPASR